MSKTLSEPTSNDIQIRWLLIFSCWLIAVMATLGSLFLSEVMGFQPCVLCWWQRIFIYPLVVIFIVGLYPLDSRVANYALPIAIIGWGFSIYHYLLYSGYIPEDLQPCGEGASCSEINLEIFGFITIPMMSILAYTTIILLLFVFKYRSK